MHRVLVGAVAAVAVLLAPATAAADALNAYTVKLRKATDLQALAQAGYDVTEGRTRTTVTIVATREQAGRLRTDGLQTTLSRDAQGRTARQIAAAAAVEGYEVWRPYARTDVPNENTEDATDFQLPILTEMQQLAAANPGFVKYVEIGRSVNGLPIAALKLTKNANSTPDGARPSVLYSSTQHAREWLSTETNRRMMRLYIDNYGETGTATGTDGEDVEGVDAGELTELVDTRELWFVIVCNPDGYDYTFESEDTRLWRKNLRDNDGNGIINTLDGVDPNRNFPNHWGYDEEGSSSDPASETFRGTGPASEPETKALDGLAKRVGFEMNSNYHTFGELLLYPLGWQYDTETADDPAFRALNGDDDNPAIPGFNPGVGAELYITNGDTNDHLYSNYDTFSMTPELQGGDEEAEEGAGGFIFQDDEDDVQVEFERQVQWALDLARSADDPGQPDSHLGNEAPAFEVETFQSSYGSPQQVQASARRDLGPVTIHWQINGGDVQTAPTTEWKGGERYGAVGDVYYHWVRGTVTGAAVGDEVKVWFTGGGETSQKFSYDQEADSGAPVLVLAAENYTGGAPPYEDTTQPNFLGYYEDMLEANGVAYDVYDLDAHGTRAPNSLGVLGHYKAVIWYTARDYATRIPGQPGGAGAARAANEIQLEVRDYLNEGGKLLHTGAASGSQYFDALDWSPKGEPYPGGPWPEDDEGNPAGPTGYCSPFPEVDDGCRALSDDFYQYYLGGYIYVLSGGVGEDGPFPITGLSDPFAGFVATLDGEDSSGFQGDIGGGLEQGAGSAVVTSSILTPDKYPHFADSALVAGWDRPGAAPYDPFSGSQYLYSQMADEAYKRYGGAVDLAGATDASLDFQISHDTENHWDHFFVEVRPAGSDDWTTLPITSGGEVISTDDPGDSCADEPADGADWVEIHPFLEHYVTRQEGDVCTNTGTTGEWHALTGNSGGWTAASVDLSDYAGEEIEVFLTYASDPAVRGLGVFLDDVSVTADGAQLFSNDFETGLEPWAVAGPPEGTAANSNDWVLSQSAFDEGPVIKTKDTLWATFGFEGITGAGKRADAMKRALTYLGVLNPGGNTPPGNGPGTGNPGGNPGGQPPKANGPLVLRRFNVRVNKRRRFGLRLKCPETGAGLCNGQYRVRYRGKRAAQKSFAIRADKFTTVKTKLSRRAFRRLNRRGFIRARVRVLTRDASGVKRQVNARLRFIRRK